MNRQGNEPENQIVLKRPRQENKRVRCPNTSSIPCSIVPSVQRFDMFPVIRCLQDHMSNWMSSRIQQQDGCLQTVAQRVTMGRVQQEQLAHAVAQKAATPSTNDQVSYFRAQLAHRKTLRGPSAQSETITSSKILDQEEEEEEEKEK